MPLPWTEVKQQPALAVAELLEWNAVNGQRKNFPCPVCDSSDALRFYPKQNWFHCFSHGGRPLTTIDFVMAVRGCSNADACRWLAGQFGIAYEDGRPAPAQPQLPPVPRPRRTTTQEDNLAALARLIAPVEPHEVYARLHARLRLSPAGAAYLAARGLHPAHADAYGFRSLDGPEDWHAVRDVLAQLRPEERAASGFPADEGRLVLPLGARSPLLLIPFWRRGALVGLRFRNLDPGAGQKHEAAGKRKVRIPKYLSLRDAPPAWPFMADGLRARVVHVVEGELNAWTLALPSYRMPDTGACGIQGAAVWRPVWTSALRAADYVVLWYDADRAGREAVALLRDEFAGRTESAGSRRTPAGSRPPPMPTSSTRTGASARSSRGHLGRTVRLRRPPPAAPPQPGPRAQPPPAPRMHENARHRHPRRRVSPRRRPCENS